MYYNKTFLRPMYTFASECLVFEGKNKPLLLENASNLTHEFLYENSHTKTHLLNLMHFQVEIVHFFLKNEALRHESVK